MRPTILLLLCLRLLLSASFLALTTDAVVSANVAETTFAAAAPGVDATNFTTAGTGNATAALRHFACQKFEALDHTDLMLAPRSGAKSSCTYGSARSDDKVYPCSNVDLLSFVPRRFLHSALGRVEEGIVNDLWGWTDKESGREFAIVGIEPGTAFVEITDPVNPRYLGALPSTGGSRSKWHDIKTLDDHAFIVSEDDEHGMQVFNLRRLLNVNRIQDFDEDALYEEFGNAHNIAINEETKYAYAVGTNTCQKGLHMIDIWNPTDPIFAGCYGGDGYTHDVQCVIYKGKDNRFSGREICFAANEDTITIVDVHNKKRPRLLSKVAYRNARYTHQGWLTEDHEFFVFGDELDEEQTMIRTTTYVLQVDDLYNPRLVGKHVADTDAVDHNQYIRGRFTYQANYIRGLRILELTDLSKAEMTEVGYFNIMPETEGPVMKGSWSVYPYFNSGTVILSGTEQGLYVLGPTVGYQPPIFRDGFEDSSGQYSKALKRISAPQRPAGATGPFVRRFVIPSRTGKKLVKEFVDIDVSNMERLTITAMMGLEEQSWDRFYVKMQVEFDDGSVNGGKANYLDRSSHLTYSTRSRTIPVPFSATAVKAIHIKVARRSRSGPTNAVLLDFVEVASAGYRSEVSRAKKVNLFNAG